MNTQAIISESSREAAARRNAEFQKIRKELEARYFVADTSISFPRKLWLKLKIYFEASAILAHRLSLHGSHPPGQTQIADVAAP